MKDERLPCRKFVTGLWGCGAFGGDSELKFVVQWPLDSHRLYQDKRRDEDDNEDEDEEEDDVDEPE